MRSVDLASAACLALAASRVCAGVNVTITDLGVPNDGQPQATSWGPLNGYHAYRITLSESDPLGEIMAADFSSSSNVAAPLHQHWVMHQAMTKTGGIVLDSKTPASTGGSNHTNLPEFYSAYDSHFVLDPAKVTLQTAPDEDNDAMSTGFGSSPFPGPIPQVFPYPPEVLGSGQGTYLRGSWTINAAAQENSVDVAYLVLPDSFFAAGPQLLATPTITTSGGQFAVPVMVVPEPVGATGFAIAVLMGQRRRRSFRSGRSFPWVKSLAKSACCGR